MSANVEGTTSSSSSLEDRGAATFATPPRTRGDLRGDLSANVDRTTSSLSSLEDQDGATFATPPHTRCDLRGVVRSSIGRVPGSSSLEGLLAMVSLLQILP